ncbi:thiol:disulfide interchange protein DsbA/DsbL [Luteibacter sp. PPL201]|jgi:thiol:disulfide interchange protein DsbA|uniref:Thiol:disulfide interchange protein n=1 Tax=Luteibacter sahnii TaxID=3021977 RepID=A0ABT6BDB3_9GAMM|nr:thiol:disulfide interchange protein DsbA/DsbL [Luteibacter sp. PPL193]MDY1549063.1 thiol:disulfide interchange protein DsbA/DsbL [Luteibacter sp. PPL193]
MFKRLPLLLAALVLSTACSAKPAEGAAASFTDGQEYVSIATPQRLDPKGKIEVVEVFSFGCIHCAHYEPKVEELQKALPRTVAFHRIPAAFNDAWLPFAQAYYAAQRLLPADKLDESTDKLFKAKWDLHMPLNAIEEMADWYHQNYGVDSAKFVQVAQGPEVKAQIEKDTKLIQQWGVDGTPTMVVDGKYRSNRIQDFDQLNAVVRFLVDKETKGGK